jgi:hypothetical protein
MLVWLPMREKLSLICLSINPDYGPKGSRVFIDYGHWSACFDVISFGFWINNSIVFVNL